MIKKRILLISPIPTHPICAGNRARINELAQSIRKIGHELYFAHIQFETGDDVSMQKWWGRDYFFQFPYSKPSKLLFRLRRKLRRLILKLPTYTYAVDDWYDVSIDRSLKDLQKRMGFDAVIAEYVFFSKALTNFSNGVLKIIDTHDKFTDRHILYSQSGHIYNWFSTSAAQEKKGLNRADIIFAIQDSERDFFAHLSGKRTFTVGHSVQIRSPNNEETIKSAILFIGSANQSNIDAITYFINEIFPNIKTAIPDAKLLIAGPVCRVINQPSKDIINCGEPEKTDKLYNKADVVINPIRFGTGLKIKNIEALGFSKPLVTTTTGAEGIEEGMNTAFLIADDAQAFSSQVISILSDPNLYKRLSQNGYYFAEQWNDKQQKTLEKVFYYSQTE